MSYTYGLTARQVDSPAAWDAKRQQVQSDRPHSFRFLSLSGSDDAIIDEPWQRRMNELLWRKFSFLFSLSRVWETPITMLANIYVI